jgi:hypothetical protein
MSSVAQTEIHVKGRPVAVSSAQVEGKTIILTGRWPKIAVPQDEELIEGETVSEPKSFVAQLKNTGLSADLFTFAQKLPDSTPKYPYRFVWDNLAIVPIKSYSDWWDNRIESSARRAVRKATKSGVVVRVADFDDEFVRGIVGINNETPIRQGRAFWHFNKSFDKVKQENSTYPGRNIFLGAYLEGELIGFMRLIRADKVASTVQLLSMMKHYDKRPANALIAKAVEVCDKENLPYLMYCNYVYNDPNSSLTEFKRRNGFEQMLVPRYYIPLTRKGELALRLGFHRSLAQRIPKPIVGQLLKLRTRWYEFRQPSPKESSS